MAVNVPPVVAAAPSTMLGMVPLPRFAGEDGGGALSSPACGGGGPAEGRWSGQPPPKTTQKVTEERL
jgi:hypothetical protein